jgi:tetratricopeptide (TPR) repeat protein
MDVIAQTINQALAFHKAGDFERAAPLYNAVLNLQPFDETTLFLLSDMYLRQDYSGLAVNLSTHLLDRNPKNGAAWCNLGVAFRKEDKYDQAMHAWNRALKIQGDTSEVCCNMATLYSDRAQPDKAIHWLDRSLKCEPDNSGAQWSKSLALLTKKDWANGWPLYDYRQKLDHWDSRAGIDVPSWDFTPTDHLYIHGEQGVGDEVMFLSCLDDVLPLAKRVTLELNDRVAGIAKLTWPNVRIVTVETPGDYSAKIPIGSIAARLRRDERAFPGVAYLRPDPALVEHYKIRLAALGPRPWVAVAWHGGSKVTRVKDRSTTLEVFKPLLEPIYVRERSV